MNRRQREAREWEEALNRIPKAFFRKPWEELNPLEAAAAIRVQNCFSVLSYLSFAKQYAADAPHFMTAPTPAAEVEAVEALKEALRLAGGIAALCGGEHSEHSERQ